MSQSQPPPDSPPIPETLDPQEADRTASSPTPLDAREVILLLVDAFVTDKHALNDIKSKGEALAIAVEEVCSSALSMEESLQRKEAVLRAACKFVGIDWPLKEEPAETSATADSVSDENKDNSGEADPATPAIVPPPPAEPNVVANPEEPVTPPIVPEPPAGQQPVEATATTDRAPDNSNSEPVDQPVPAADADSSEAKADQPEPAAADAPAVEDTAAKDLVTSGSSDVSPAHSNPDEPPKTMKLPSSPPADADTDDHKADENAPVEPKTELNSDEVKRLKEGD